MAQSKQDFAVLDDSETETVDLARGRAMLGVHASALHTAFRHYFAGAREKSGEFQGWGYSKFLMALRAQEQCRSALVTLTKMQDPPAKASRLPSNTAPDTKSENPSNEVLDSQNA